MSTKLRANKVMQPLFRLYDWFMMKTGLFALKKKIKHHFFLRSLLREDAALKRQVAHEIEQLPFNMLHRKNDASDVIVSLTSYGKRVSDSVPYAIYSIFKQSILPNRIVLWLDKDNWNDDNLPYLLKRLKQSGLEIYYCEDIRSYKKILPSLRKFSNNPIVTFDDDFYFNANYLQWLLETYSQSDKKTVIGGWGCSPVMQDGKYLHVDTWVDCKKAGSDAPIMLFTGYGTLYPPHVFDGEICNKEIFQKLCPTADDIWCWAMEERQHVKREYIPYKGYGHHRPIDRIYDYDIAGDGCLTIENVLGGQNDVQLRKLLEYYHLGEMTEF